MRASYNDFGAAELADGDERDECEETAHEEVAGQGRSQRRGSVVLVQEGDRPASDPEIVPMNPETGSGPKRVRGVRRSARPML